MNLPVKIITIFFTLVFANSAYTQGTSQGAPPFPIEKEQHQHLLMEFCRGLWDAWTGDQQAVLTVGDLEPSRPPWLIENVVLRDGGTILFAPPGKGKSYTGMLLAQSLNYGREELWHVGSVRSDWDRTDNDSDVLGGALYLNLERSRRSQEARLGNVNEALGLPRDSGMLMIHGRGKTLEKVMDGAARTIREHACSLVVLDSLSRAGVGDLSSNEAANRAMDLLNGLGVAWLCLAHTPREDESHVYGSQLFDAAADLAIRAYSAVRDDGAIGVALHVTKTNDTGYPDPQLLVYEFGPYGLRNVMLSPDGRGFPDAAGVELLERARS